MKSSAPFCIYIVDNFEHSVTAPVPTLCDAQLALSTEPDATIELARRWLNGCLDNHTACNSERKSKVWPVRLPKRLLDVGLLSTGATTPHIVDAQHLEPTTPYMTLSHSWGDANFLKLESTNIAELMSEVPIQALSQTHQDALSITRRLGYRYLWIDLLCIVQDSTEDWRAEAAKMASVYGNSTCNIAAKGANSHAGCFVQRNPLGHRPCQLIRTEDDDPTQGVYAHPSPTANYQSFNHYNYANNSPLLERAWVQQERLLPPRILYFGGPEIHWECCSLQASETWPFGPPSDEHGFDEVVSLEAAFETELRPFTEWSNDDYYTFIFKLWRNGIVREYTAAKLSFERDRLAALAGIASVIQTRTDLSFVAGLWKELLPLELLWHRDSPLMTREDQRNNGDGWEAPTWSWASLIGKVRHSVPALSHTEDRKETYSCQVIDCQITGTLGDRYTDPRGTL